MAKIARYEMPDGRIGRFEVPDDATPEQAQALIAQSLEPKASVEVTGAPMENPVWASTGGGAALGKPRMVDRTNVLPEPRPLESALAGATKSIINPVVGAAQMATGGNLGTSELAQRLGQEGKVYEEANPGSYMAGQVAGAVAPASMGAKGIGMIPSLAKLSPYAQAAGVGAVGGLMTPEETGKKDLALLGEELKNAGIGSVLGAATPAVGKVLSTAGGAAKAALEPFSQSGRNMILGRALRQFSGNDAEKAIQNLRNAKELVPGSQPTVGEAAGVPSLAALQRAAIGSSPQATNALANRQALQNEARTTALQNIAPESRVSKYVNLREEVSNDLYDKALNTKLALAPEDAEVVQSLIKTPAISKAMNQAKENAANRGVDIADPAGSMRGLHETKMALDDQIASVKAKLDRDGGGATSAELRSLIAAKDRLLGFLDDVNPAYKEASKVYARLSKPIDQLENIANIANKSVSPESQKIWAGRFASELKKVKDQDILSKAQIARLDAISEDLKRATYAMKEGQGVGSNTVEKLAYNNMLQEVNLPSLLRRRGMAETAGNIGARVKDIAYGAANKQLTNEMAEALLDPRKAAAMMKLAGRKPLEAQVSPEKANLARLLFTQGGTNAIRALTKGNENE